MQWNWQQSDWPNFTWETGRLGTAEKEFLVSAGVYLGNAEHLAAENQERLLVDAICSEAVTTSEIEGEILNRDSVQSSVRRQLGLSTDGRRSSPAESGIAEMMVHLYRGHDQPLTHTMLWEWHEMLCNGRRDLREIGQYRKHEEPMQVVSGKLHDPRIHFEAPPSSRVPAEMERFLTWFESTSPSGTSPLPALTRSGIAHLYFESIHPFEDGNGRIGRAIAEKALAQGLGRPYLTALSTTILQERRSYYAALEQANRSNEITDWLAWSAGISLTSQHRTQAQVDFLIAKAKLFERLRGQLNRRQELALERMFREGIEGFRGGLSAGNYVSITQASSATATRDLAGLVEMGALTAHGDKKYRRYHLAIPTGRSKKVVLDAEGRLVDG
ncbi:MAG: Fic family protein [Planctomycetota bacterium]